MRSTAFVWAVFAGVLAACSDESATAPDSGTDATNPSDAATDGNDVSVPQGETINGKVLHFESNVPAKNVAVTLVDAKGVVRTTTTAADGSFSVAEVATPYAVRCVDPDEYRNFSWAWDEISAKTIVLGVEDLSTFGWANHSMNLSCQIQLPTCIAGNCGLVVTPGDLATATDTRVFGSRGDTFSNPGTIAEPLAVQWYGGSSSRSATIEALAWDPGGFNYWYGSQVVTLKDGQPPTCGPIVLASVPSPDSILATLQTTNLGSTFQRRSYFTFEMPSGAFLDARTFTTDSFAVGLPQINMKSWALTGGAVDSVTGSNAGGTTSSQPPSTLSGTVSLFGPPVPTHGPSITSGGKITWLDGSGPGLYNLWMGRSSDAGSTFVRYFTAQTSVPLDRLRKLGANVDPGSFSYSLIAYRPFNGIDALLAGPNAPKRAFFSSSSRTDATFTVTP